MTREELKEHCKRQIQQFERIEKIMPVTPNDWKRYEEHKLILELLEQEPKVGHWLNHKEYCDKNNLLPSGYGSCFWCSECDCAIDSKNFSRVNYNYCPNCGADMREVEE